MGADTESVIYGTIEAKDQLYQYQLNHFIHHHLGHRFGTKHIPLYYEISFIFNVQLTYQTIVQLCKIRDGLNYRNSIILCM